MLTELCQYLKNWEFDKDPEKYIGTITISDGQAYIGDPSALQRVPLVTGQYFRVIGSIFNDGIHQCPDFEMPDETFDGAVWAMYIPPDVVRLADEIAEWRAKYEALDSTAMSPFNSESFAGYSYSKSGAGGSAGGNNGLSGWQSVFAPRLNSWRKI